MASSEDTIITITASSSSSQSASNNNSNHNHNYNSNSSSKRREETTARQRHDRHNNNSNNNNSNNNRPSSSSAVAAAIAIAADSKRGLAAAGPLEAARARMRHLSISTSDQQHQYQHHQQYQYQHHPESRTRPAASSDSTENGEDAAQPEAPAPRRRPQHHHTSSETALLRQELKQLEIRHQSRSKPRPLSTGDETPGDGHPHGRDAGRITPSRQRPSGSRRHSSRSNISLEQEKSGDESQASSSSASARNVVGDDSERSRPSGRRDEGPAQQNWRDWRAARKRRDEEESESRNRASPPPSSAPRHPSRSRSGEEAASARSVAASTSSGRDGNASHREPTKKGSSRRRVAADEDGPWRDWSSRRDLDGKGNDQQSNHHRSRSQGSDRRNDRSQSSDRRKDRSQSSDRRKHGRKKHGSKRSMRSLKDSDHTVSSDPNQTTEARKDLSREAENPLFNVAPNTNATTMTTTNDMDSVEELKNESNQPTQANRNDTREENSASYVTNKAAGAPSSRQTAGGIRSTSAIKANQQTFDVPAPDMDESHALRRRQTRGVPSAEKDESHALRKKQLITRAQSQRSLSASSRSIVSGDSGKRKVRQVFDEITPYTQWSSRSSRSFNADDAALRDGTPGRRRHRFLQEISKWKQQFGSKRNVEPSATQRSFRRRKTFEAVDLSRSSDATVRTKIQSTDAAATNRDPAHVPEDRTTRPRHASVSAKDTAEAPAASPRKPDIVLDAIEINATRQADSEPGLRRDHVFDRVEHKSSSATTATVKHSNTEGDVSDSSLMSESQHASLGSHHLEGNADAREIVPGYSDRGTSNPNEVVIDRGARLEDSRGTLADQSTMPGSNSERTGHRERLLSENATTVPSETAVEGGCTFVGDPSDDAEETCEGLQADEKKPHKKSKKKRKKNKESKSKRRSKSVESPRQLRLQPMRSSSAEDLESSMSLSDIFQDHPKNDSRESRRLDRSKHGSGNESKEKAGVDSSHSTQSSSQKESFETDHTLTVGGQPSGQATHGTLEHRLRSAHTMPPQRFEDDAPASRGTDWERSSDTLSSSHTMSTAGGSNDTIETDNTAKNGSVGDGPAAVPNRARSARMAANEASRLAHAGKKKSRKSRKKKFAIPPPPLAGNEMSDEDARSYPTPYM